MAFSRLTVQKVEGYGGHQDKQSPEVPGLCWWMNSEPVLSNAVYWWVNSEPVPSLKVLVGEQLC